MMIANFAAVLASDVLFRHSQSVDIEKQSRRLTWAQRYRLSAKEEFAAMAEKSLA